MFEFDCQRCGVHVIDIVGEQHPERIYCLECRFIESIEDPEARAAAEAFLARKHAEIDRALGLEEK